MSGVLDSLRARDRQIAREITQLHEERREVRDAIDTLALLERPAFPTRAHLRGLDEAVRRIRARETPRSHHGDPTDREHPWPAAVVVDGARGWLQVRHGAPYKVGTGTPVWRFSDGDLALIFTYLRESGAEIVRWWWSDGGVSIEVTV